MEVHFMEFKLSHLFVKILNISIFIFFIVVADTRLINPALTLTLKFNWLNAPYSSYEYVNQSKVWNKSITAPMPYVNEYQIQR